MKRQSFTLIELLIVLVIIGIVVTLAVPQYQLFVIRMRGAEAMTNLRAIADSAWRYYIEAGAFPPVQDTPYPPPPMIDIKVPAQTRYFKYTYWYPTPQGFLSGVTIGANDNDALDNGPIGAIVSYRIDFLYDRPEYAQQRGQKLNEHWYRYYWYGVID
jgi:prepilin-type N-terminal cleavage/methylation domain-containing protein